MMLGGCACPILLPCVGCRLQTDVVGRELFGIQRGTDGLPVVRLVTDQLKSFLSNLVGLGYFLPEAAAVYVHFLFPLWLLRCFLQYDEVSNAVYDHSLCHSLYPSISGFFFSF